MTEEVQLKDNQFKLENGDICEVSGNTVINISDIQRKKAEENQTAAKEDVV